MTDPRLDHSLGKAWLALCLIAAGLGLGALFGG